MKYSKSFKKLKENNYTDSKVMEPFGNKYSLLPTARASNIDSLNRNLEQFLDQAEIII